MSARQPELITSQFDGATRALEVVEGVDLQGKTAIVTGGGAGIGLEITRALAAAGAEILIGDIDEARSADGLADIARTHPRAKVKFARVDLGDLASVRDFATAALSARPKLDMLINNAAVMAPEKLTYSKSGHELQFGVNYLGHFCLVNQLLPALRNAKGARVVSVSSIGHKTSDVNFDDIDFRNRPYDRWLAYGQSKTACALLAVAITETQREAGITSNALNPGGSMTGLQRHVSDEDQRKIGWVTEGQTQPAHWREPAQCAATSVWAAVGKELEGIGGRYLEHCREAGPWVPEKPMYGVQPHALSRENALRLWDMAKVMVR